MYHSYTACTNQAHTIMVSPLVLSESSMNIAHYVAECAEIAVAIERKLFSCGVEMCTAKNSGDTEPEAIPPIETMIRDIRHDTNQLRCALREILEKI